MLLHTAAGGGQFMLEGSLLGLIEQSSRFLRPVYAADTLNPRLRVGELTPQRTTGILVLASSVHNQRAELVMEGIQKYLLKRRQA